MISITCKEIYASLTVRNVLTNIGDTSAFSRSLDQLALVVLMPLRSGLSEKAVAGVEPSAEFEVG